MIQISAKTFDNLLHLPLLQTQLCSSMSASLLFLANPNPVPPLPQFSQDLKRSDPWGSWNCSPSSLRSPDQTLSSSEDLPDNMECGIYLHPAHKYTHHDIYRILLFADPFAGLQSVSYTCKSHVSMDSLCSGSMPHAQTLASVGPLELRAEWTNVSKFHTCKWHWEQWIHPECMEN